MAWIGNQFSSGDQGLSREDFWRSGFKVCQSCGKRDIKCETHPAGCRMNGDAYGTEVFTCRECGWNTSFQYDDASDDCYYYETRYWTRDPPVPKVVSKTPLTDDLKIKFRKIYSIVGKSGTIDAMRMEGISSEELISFLSELEAK